eukprot:COSAG02_NODE_430_length_22462_cov_52.755042_20_plen_21_part_01
MCEEAQDSSRVVEIAFVCLHS